MPETNLKEKKEEIKDTLSDLTTHANEYFNTFYRLQVLNLTKKTTDLTANILGGLISVVLGMFVLFFGSVALAWWVGDLLGSRAGGFAAVAGFYALVAIIILAIRKKIVFPFFRNLIIKKIYE